MAASADFSFGSSGFVGVQIGFGSGSLGKNLLPENEFVGK
jgi:hypothetical protein